MVLRLWLFIIAALFVQEVAAANAALLAAVENHFNLWSVHGIFMAATALDITGGYYAGKVLQRYYGDSALVARSHVWAHKVEEYMGESGQHLVLLLLGLLSFVYVDAFLVSWLKLPFRDVFLFLFVGDLLWYTAEWLVVLGVRFFVPNPYIALLAIVSLSLVIVLALRWGRNYLGDRF